MNLLTSVTLFPWGITTFISAFILHQLTHALLIFISPSCHNCFSVYLISRSLFVFMMSTNQKISPSQSQFWTFAFMVSFGNKDVSCTSPVLYLISFIDTDDVDGITNPISNGFLGNNCNLNSYKFKFKKIINYIVLYSNGI
jgi:hypothetical protein